MGGDRSSGANQSGGPLIVAPAAVIPNPLIGGTWEEDRSGPGRVGRGEENVGQRRRCRRSLLLANAWLLQPALRADLERLRAGRVPRRSAHSMWCCWPAAPL